MRDGSVDHFKAHIGDPTGGDAQHLGCTMGEVDDAAACKRTPIIDANNGGTTVVEVGDTHPGAEGEVAMGCREGAWAENFTTGCAISKETRAIPAGLTNLNAPGGCKLLTLGQGRRWHELDEIVVPAWSWSSNFGGNEGAGCWGGDGGGLSWSHGSSRDQKSCRAEEMECTHDNRNRSERQIWKPEGAHHFRNDAELNLRIGAELISGRIPRRG